MQEHKKSFDIRLRDKKRELQKIQARAIERKDLRLKKMQALVCEKRTMIAELTQDAKANSRRTTKLLKLSMSIRDKTIERARQRDEKAKWWKREYEDLVKQLHVVTNKSEELVEQLVEWKDIAADMKQQYDSMNSMQPCKIRKVWVKNIGTNGETKKGEYKLNNLCHILPAKCISHEKCLLVFYISGGHMEWMPHVEKLILEMLANRTPPTCIQSNIVAFCGHILPGQDIIKEIPSVKHIRNMRTVQLTIAKTLAAMQVGRSPKIKQLHTDETSKRQTQITDVVLSLLQDDKSLKTICLAADLICADGTAEEQTKGILHSFADGGRLLDRWRLKVKEMFKEDPEMIQLLAQIPMKESLSVSRLLGSYITTDTCNTAKVCSV